MRPSTTRSGSLRRLGDPPGALRQLLRARSWTGRGGIHAVEVSTDGGASWRCAPLHGPNAARAWTRWELPWTPPPGAHELLARATDPAGLRQPETVPFNDGGYQVWAVARHPVSGV